MKEKKKNNRMRMIAGVLFLLCAIVQAMLIWDLGIAGVLMLYTLIYILFAAAAFSSKEQLILFGGAAMAAGSLINLMITFRWGSGPLVYNLLGAAGWSCFAVQAAKNSRKKAFCMITSILFVLRLFLLGSGWSYYYEPGVLNTGGSILVALGLISAVFVYGLSVSSEVEKKETLVRMEIPKSITSMPEDNSNGRTISLDNFDEDDEDKRRGAGAEIRENKKLDQIIAEIADGKRTPEESAADAAVTVQVDFFERQAEQLTMLKKLYDQGVLTEEEFTAKKRDILGL